MQVQTAKPAKRGANSTVNVLSEIENGTIKRILGQSKSAATLKLFANELQSCKFYACNQKSALALANMPYVNHETDLIGCIGENVVYHISKAVRIDDSTDDVTSEIAKQLAELNG